MTFIRDIAALFNNRSISVTIDPLLLPHIKCYDKINTQRIISFNLYKLIYHIGTIQSRRFATSNRLKLFDKMDLIEKIHANTNEFRIRINDIRQINGTEALTSISEDFGIGVSVVIAESLFDTKSSTIQKIYGTRRRPDWKCQLIDNRILVVEGKGSTSIQTSNTQETDALDQKTREPGDIRVASLTVLNENSISETRYLDPPIEADNISPEMQNHILRAGHYASVFSFLGNSKLSRYYSQMRKRLEGLITTEEQSLKNQTFRELRLEEPTVDFEGENFAGSFYKIEEQKYLFVGVDKRLLSFQGFITYDGFENDIQQERGENMYALSREGILIIYIGRIEEFRGIVDINGIKNFQDNITMSDIDEMNEISFVKYFEYLLNENGFTNVRGGSSEYYLGADLIALKDSRTYFFQFKISKNKEIGITDVQRIVDFRQQIKIGKLVFVSNADFPDAKADDLDATIIDREKLRELIKNSALLLQLTN
jgi:hypothetical protein